MAARYWIQKIIGFVLATMVVAAIVVIFQSVRIPVPPGAENFDSPLFTEPKPTEYRGPDVWQLERMLHGDGVDSSFELSAP
jgi:hypothetical protein